MANHIARCFALTLLALSFGAAALAEGAPTTDYIVVYVGNDSADGFQVGGDNLLYLEPALSAVTAAGGVITADLTHEFGVVIASSASPTFAEVLRLDPLVAEVCNSKGHCGRPHRGGPPTSCGPSLICRGIEVCCAGPDPTVPTFFCTSSGVCP